jgi:hypothetical protein
MKPPIKDVMTEAMAVPLGGIIAAVGRGVAEAQAALDAASLAQTLAIHDAGDDAAQRLLREIGYRPTFYVLPETLCEVQVSLTVSGGEGTDRPARPDRLGIAPELSRPRSYATPVDAGFANRFAYQVQAAAKLSFKIVPVPPPSGADEARLVPAVASGSFEDARKLLAARDLGAEAVDKDGASVPEEARATMAVKGQLPEAGEIVRAGETVRLTLG